MRKFFLSLSLFLMAFASPHAHLMAQSAPAIRSFMSFQGAYSSGTIYTRGDMVTYSGATYVSIVPNNLGFNPSSSPTEWTTLFTGGGGGGGSTTINAVAGPFTFNGAVTNVGSTFTFTGIPNNLNNSQPCITGDGNSYLTFWLNSSNTNRQQIQCSFISVQNSSGTSSTNVNLGPDGNLTGGAYSGNFGNFNNGVLIGTLDDSNSASLEIDPSNGARALDIFDSNNNNVAYIDGEGNAQFATLNAGASVITVQHSTTIIAAGTGYFGSNQQNSNGTSLEIDAKSGNYALDLFDHNQNEVSTVDEHGNAIFASVQCGAIGSAGPCGGASFAFPGIPYASSATASGVATPAQIQEAYTPVFNPTSATLLADYDMRQGSGTVLADISGKNFCGGAPCNGTLGNTGGSANATVPTWTTNGLFFIPGNGVSLPAQLNPVPLGNAGQNSTGAQTFVFAVYTYPEKFYPNVPSGQPAAPASVCDSGPGGLCQQNFQFFLSSGVANGTGVNLGLTNFSSPFHYGSMSSSSNNTDKTLTTTYPGPYFHVYTYVLGYPVYYSTYDQFYVDGVLVSNSLTGSSASQAAANMYLGDSGVSQYGTASAGFYGVMTRAQFYANAMSAADVMSVTQQLYADAANRGIQTVQNTGNYGQPHIIATGDSITNGVSTAGNGNDWPHNLTLMNQPAYTIDNWGQDTADLGYWAGFLGADALRCDSNGQSFGIGQGGHNDIDGLSVNLNSAQMAQILLGYMAEEVNRYHEHRCKFYLTPILDTTDSPNGTTGDANKNAIVAAFSAGWKGIGADGFINTNEDPLLGADGAASNTTYYLDGTHPTAAGQLLTANLISNFLNYQASFGLAPTRVTATYTMNPYDDSVFLAPTAAVTLTLPTCLIGAPVTFTLYNPQSAYAVTLKTANSSQTLNGVDYSTTGLTLASSATTTITAVPLPSTTGGCVWTK